MTNNPAPAPHPVTALLLAGSRPGRDPLASAFGETHKALVEVGGAPMVARVARTLLDHPRIGTVVILAQEPAALTARPNTAWLADHPRVRWQAGGSSISGAVLACVDDPGLPLPLLVTTADHVLLTEHMLDSMIAAADAGTHDLCVGLVSAAVLLRGYPDSRRTWLRFRGGAYTGCNLFLLASRAVRPALLLWRGVEQERKKGWRLILAFGPWLALNVALRRWDVTQAFARAGARLGLRAAPVLLEQAEAGIDVDKPDDHALATRILAARQAP